MANLQVHNFMGTMSASTILLNKGIDNTDYFQLVDLPNFNDLSLPGELFTDGYYEIVNNDINTKEKLEIITHFVSELLDNTEDLKPEYSKWIDENFWDLF